MTKITGCPIRGRSQKRLFIAALVFASAIAGPSIAEDRTLEFTPANGFGGYSEGNGSLKLFFGKPRPFHVESHGYAQKDGTFRLDQTVTFQAQPPQDRVWLLATTRPDHYEGTLSDAAGHATGCTRGARLFLHYRVKGPLVMHQELELMPDGKIINNVGTITLLGIPVGHLHETITRQDPGVPSKQLVNSPPSIPGA